MCDYPVEQQRSEAERIRKKYPDRVPVLCYRAKKCTSVPEIDKHKYLVPNDLTVGQFLYVIRKRIKLAPEQALFFFVNNTMPSTSMTMSHLYKEQKNPKTLFCDIEYSAENTFGCVSLFDV